MRTFKPCVGCTMSQSSVCEPGKLNDCTCSHCWEAWVLYEDGEADTLLDA